MRKSRNLSNTDNLTIIPENQYENYLIYLLQDYLLDKEFHPEIQYAIPPILISLMGGLGKIGSLMKYLKKMKKLKKIQKEAQNIPVPGGDMVPRALLDEKTRSMENWVWRLQNQVRSMGGEPVKQDELDRYNAVVPEGRPSQPPEEAQEEENEAEDDNEFYPDERVSTRTLLLM